MRKFLWLIGLLLLILTVGIVQADDTTAEPGTPADNECYPGGVLYRERNQDGCPTLWYWKAGWYLARFNRGLISREEFPKEFESVLPPLEVVHTICATTNVSGVWYGCMSSNRSGFENFQGAFFSYLLFVNKSSECPAVFNGMASDGTDSTQDYMIDYYHFTGAQLASIGGVRPVTCIYSIL